MKDYWLAKLIASVQEVDSRKRLQKSIYLLQLAGCPLRCDYLLHYYGPYSFELSGLVDQLNAAEIIGESKELTGFGNVRYTSQITDKGSHLLANFEKSQTGKKTHTQIKPFISLFQELNKQDLWILELGATVAYYYDGDWKEAQAQTAKFKGVATSNSNLRKAVTLAKRFKKSA